MDLGLAGKTAIVTGGASNIGRAISLAFAKEGANVVIADKHLEGGQNVASTGDTLGSGRCLALRTDVTKLDDVEAMVASTLEEFNKLDVLVNNVGWTKLGSFIEVDSKWWQPMVALNFICTLNGFRVVLPIMKKQGSGSIISIASVVGRRGDYHEPVYAALKSAVINFSRSMAQEYAHDKIRINVVAPGLTMPTGPETLEGDSMWKPGGSVTQEWQDLVAREAVGDIPLGKIGKAIDVAHAVLFLASDVAAGHITGHIIGVDGGLYMEW
jgi:2-hydroxycyclohexanecarboxyl-CoA dehydrogenase